MQEQYKIQYAEYINSLPPEKRHMEEEKSRLKRKKQPHQDVKVTVEPEAPTTSVTLLFCFTLNLFRKKSDTFILCSRKFK